MTAPTLSYGFARAQGVIVTALGDVADVARRAGSSVSALSEVRRLAGRPLRIREVGAAEYDRLLQDHYAATAYAGGADDLAALSDDLPSAEDLLASDDEAPAIRLINGLIAEAARLKASDIHIEPFETGLVVRMRLDGELRELHRLPPGVAPLLASRIKVMARLDIAERRLPQDGRMELALGGKRLDVRVSTLPARGGERVVLRLLDKDNAGIDLVGLGMPAAIDASLRAALAEPNGLVLVTGPTGSGKTTTLYAGLKLLNDGRRNILTVEDPVEYAVDGIGQTQVNARVGLSFAAGLRAILRQDPDVVMVGEIRDGETAGIAVQAALTGHLVLSSLHTNDAASAITRLRDFGVEPFLLAATLRAVVAQRLVRRLCPSCRTSRPADAGAASSLGLTAGDPIWHADGCTACNHTGWQGRVGLFEIIRMTDALATRIHAGASAVELAEAAGSPGLAAIARQAVIDGLTTAAEALRVMGLPELEPADG
ncbi:ATPase, T2SS/T4P/T4SS family [Sandarakinorhabdus sp.]|jgi:general secretion pathway protein E|uniref:GspE/PulE family protein n=1 Tax=Sandarakinorhabdus sp. TaxID=1916663 RepID=UPI0033415E20